MRCAARATRSSPSSSCPDMNTRWLTGRGSEKHSPDMPDAQPAWASRRGAHRLKRITGLSFAMAELERITIGPGLTFDARVAGDPGGPLVLLLHGFAESMHTWRAQVTALAAAGYRAIAPSQRG